MRAVPDKNAVLTCAGVHLEDNPVSPSAKRACKIPPPVSQIPTQQDIEMGTVSLPVPEDAMEVDFDAPTWKYVQTPLVSTATVMQLKH